MILKSGDIEVERPSEQFEIEMSDGKVYTLKHTKSLPITTIIRFPFLPPVAQLQAMIGDDDFDAFCANPEADGWFMEQLSDRYMKHYGLGDEGESDASSD